MSDFLFQLVLAVIPAVLAITLHEAAHGYAALALGDPTARLAGRLSLNPLRHIDRFGTIILPSILLISQLISIGRVEFMFGWAKPVPINPWAFANPRRGTMWVALAGPGMNFVLAWLAALALHPFGEPEGTVELTVQELLLRFILFNLVLGLFNLLPLPPLDGGRVMVGVLPLPLARVWARLEGAGIAIVLIGLFVLPLVARELGFGFDPLRDALGAVLPWALRWVFYFAGV
ncbi:MAG: site-2 protease family protein [Acetobacteraceae bacterium]|nr:site-2 protease family protein [Acetobacteraceae bacterium]